MHSLSSVMHYIRDEQHGRHCARRRARQMLQGCSTGAVGGECTALDDWSPSRIGSWLSCRGAGGFTWQLPTAADPCRCHCPLFRFVPILWLYPQPQPELTDGKTKQTCAHRCRQRAHMTTERCKSKRQRTSAPGYWRTSRFDSSDGWTWRKGDK
ncbi:hypothetical protein BV25DRAFT_684435 [Artomyces pyxidatus]|uniref:Uncharacterized protein n=1 Tax=Artomyces pyxidatus TaxID=48021 RepID=A0ACB8T2S1_9AGAM|nr:hypothetical protein BV25DRAFT_684435 [Artomyces pyxidatus]